MNPDNKHYEAIHRHDFLTKELLEEEYVKNLLTDKQIAKKYDVSSKVIIWRKRQEFGIPNRFSGKSNKNACVNRKYDLSKEEALQLQENGSTYKNVAEYLGCSKIVAQRRLKELGLCKEQKHTEKYLSWNVELNVHQKQLVIGSTLGDGSITKSGSYTCSHSIKQNEYFQYKMNLLTPIHSGTCHHTVSKAKGIDGKNYENYCFLTYCNSYISELRKIYYPNGIKVFNFPFLLDNLEAEGLAYWYMDDGSFYYSRFCIICTFGYKPLEHILMKELFMMKWGLNVSVRTDHSKPADKCHYLCFSGNEAEKFLSLVRPYIVPSMSYKIGIGTYQEKIAGLNTASQRTPESPPSNPDTLVYDVTYDCED